MKLASDLARYYDSISKAEVTIFHSTHGGVIGDRSTAVVVSSNATRPLSKELSEPRSARCPMLPHVTYFTS